MQLHRPSTTYHCLPVPQTNSSRCVRQVSLHGFLGFSVPTSEPQTYPLTFPQPDWPVKADPSFIGPFYSKCVMGEVGGEETDTRRPGVYYRWVQCVCYPPLQVGAVCVLSTTTGGCSVCVIHHYRWVQCVRYPPC